MHFLCVLFSSFNCRKSTAKTDSTTKTIWKTKFLNKPPGWNVKPKSDVVIPDSDASDVVIPDSDAEDEGNINDMNNNNKNDMDSGTVVRGSVCKINENHKDQEMNPTLNGESNQPEKYVFLVLAHKLQKNTHTHMHFFVFFC